MGRVRTIAAVLVSLLSWVAAYAAVDMLVLQIYPMPPEYQSLPRELWTRETVMAIIATRPNAAVALNLSGNVIAAAGAAFMASRLAGIRSTKAGCVVTCSIVLLAVMNSVLTQNWRWMHPIAFALYPVAGYWGHRRAGGVR